MTGDRRPRPADLDALLLQSIADRRLSRTERKVLRDVLGDAAFDRAQIAELRSRVFEIAAGAVADPHSREVLGWVAEVARLLAAAAERGAGEVRSRAYFAPGDDCAAKISELIRSARRSVDVCVFTITDNRITRALREAHAARVSVRILSDDEKALDLGSDLAELAGAGIPVAFDRGESHMHHKFALFDRSRLLTGSYNWTRNADLLNFENFLVTDDPALVAAYGREFDRLLALFS